MIAAIEKAILERLRLAGEALNSEDLSLLGYKFGTRETYPDDWDAALISSTVTFPAAYANFGSFATLNTTSGTTMVEAVFEVSVIAENKRNKTASRHGFTPATGKLEVGSLQVGEDVIGLLQGQAFGLDIGGFELLAGQAPEMSDAATKKGLSAFTTRWKTTFTYDRGTPAFDQGAIGDFTTFASDWDVPPFGTEPEPSIEFQTHVTLPAEEA